MDKMGKMDMGDVSHLVEIKDIKLKLINRVASLMIHEPRYYSPDPSVTKSELTHLLTEIAARDPEFVWKVILYVRDELNIRSTANWMMAVAANLKPCHAFFEKYFSDCVRLPSDLLDVVNLYLDLPGRYLPDRSLPAVLRTAIQQKFTEFDNYQLAKYNKEKSTKNKAKKLKEENDKTMLKMAVERSAPDSETQEVTAAKGPTKLTLKQVIRKVHLADPADAVCAILGKKYPESEEAFKKMGLSGEFDPAKAGKRMKLPLPVTWETQLSARGNTHATWEKLIDEKKLPFMAMLRNLRNLIVTGISPKHHEQILARLTDEKSVINSRQLPWRFLSAYQAIDIDLEKLMNDMLDHDGSKYKIVQVPVKGRKGKQMAAKRTIRKRVHIPVHMPDLPLIQRYQEAIDTAIRLATLHNLPPIEGRTVIFCDVSGSMKQPCKSKGNMGSIQEAFEIGILMGLMIQSCCDEADYRIFSSPARDGGKCHLSIPLVENTILANVKRVSAESEKLGGGTDFPFDYLEDLIVRKEKIDNFIILSDMMIAPGHMEMDGQGSYTVTGILEKYRKEVNPDLLFISVDLCGCKGASLVEACEGKHPNDVLISGFSDGILKFIAQRGSLNKQLEYVENIDKTKRLGRKKAANQQRKNGKSAKKAAEEDGAKDKDVSAVEQKEEEELL